MENFFIIEYFSCGPDIVEIGPITHIHTISV